MFPLLILLPLLSIKLYLYVRMSTLSSFSIKQQVICSYCIIRPTFLGPFFLLGYGNSSSETRLFIRL